MWIAKYLCIFAMVAIFQNVSSMTIDQLIQNAATSSQQFEFLDENNKYVQTELDMKFELDQWQELKKRNASTTRQKRKAVRDTRFRWPNAQIAYEIPNGIFSSRDMTQINAALNDWQMYTCISFRQTSTDRSRVRFQDGSGCSSFVGRTGRVQALTLARGCRGKGTIIHEIGHAVGFHHEQTRPDRDQFVRILRENIPQNVFFNFQKYTTNVINDFGVPYDYSSIMHYGGTAFSTNGRLTIQTLDPAFQGIIGNRRGLSFLDVKLANLMYDCAGRNDCPTRNCPDDGFVGKDCQCWCRGNPVKRCDGGEIGNGTETTMAPVTQDPDAGSCKDMNSNCERWANRNECRRNPSYMLMFCQKSCNVCSEVSSCKDMNVNCDYWQGRGYCNQMYVTYMRTNCPMACGVCSSDEVVGSSAAATTMTSLSLILVGIPVVFFGIW